MAGITDKLKEVVENITSDKDDVVEDDKVEEKEEALTGRNSASGEVYVHDNNRGLSNYINEIRKKAFKMRKVIITYNDKRDNNMVQTAYLTCENQYFARNRVVPLDTPVEIEQCLVDCALEAQISTHVDEIIDGKRTNKMTNKITNKYSVSIIE